MLESYEAIYDQGQFRWLKEAPQVKSARVIVTILEESPVIPKRRMPPPSIAGKAKTLGDIVHPIVSEE